MCCRFIIEKRSLRHCCVAGLSKVCGGLGIGERKGGGRGDLFYLLVWLEIKLLYLCVYLKEQFVLYIVRYKHFVMDIKRISIL